SVVEGFSGVYGILSGHGIYYEKRFVRLYGLMNVGNFVHHLLIDSQTSGCIDDDYVEAIRFGMFDSILSNFNSIFVFRFRIYFNTDLFSDHMQLDKSRMNEDIRSYK